MSKVKTLLPEDYETEAVNDIPPEELEHDLQQAHREWELSKYDTEELETEIQRRTYQDVKPF